MTPEPHPFDAELFDLPGPDGVLVHLTATDVQVICVAMADLKDALGNPAWRHPNVMRLRDKLAAAIQLREQQLAN